MKPQASRAIAEEPFYAPVGVFARAASESSHASVRTSVPVSDRRLSDEPELDPADALLWRLELTRHRPGLARLAAAALAVGPRGAGATRIVVR